MAQLYIKVNKNKAKYMLFQTDDIFEWFYLDDNNIWRTSCKKAPSPLKDDIYNVLSPIFRQKLKNINSKNCKLFDKIDEEKENQKKAKKDKKNIITFDISTLNALETQVNFGNAQKSKITKIIQVLGDANECKGIIEYLETYFKNNRADKSMFHNPNYFACNNKLFDCTYTENNKGIKKVVGWRDIEPEDYIVQTTGYDYKEDASETIIEEIIKYIETFFIEKEVAYYFIKQLARALNGDLKGTQHFNVMLGTGSNGKSCLFKVLADIFGEYHTGLSKTFITSKKETDDEKPTPMKYSIMGKRIIVFSEPNKSENLDCSIVKMISSGEDIIKARKLHMNPVAFYPQALLYLPTNYNPKYDDKDSEGMSRRMFNWYFQKKFTTELITPDDLEINPFLSVANPKWSQLFTKNEYKQAFMKLLSRVYLKEFSQSLCMDTGIPEFIQKATQAFNNENNDIAKWLDERYSKIDEADEEYSKISYSVSELLSAYNTDTGDASVNINNIGLMLKKAGVVLKRPYKASTFLYFGYKRNATVCLLEASKASCK